MAVSVIGPLIVIVHENGNATLIVIPVVDEVGQPALLGPRCTSSSTVRSGQGLTEESLQRRPLVHGHAHGGDHVDDHGDGSPTS